MPLPYDSPNPIVCPLRTLLHKASKRWFNSDNLLSRIRKLVLVRGNALYVYHYNTEIYPQMIVADLWFATSKELWRQTISIIFLIQFPSKLIEKDIHWSVLRTHCSWSDSPSNGHFAHRHDKHGHLKHIENDKNKARWFNALADDVGRLEFYPLVTYMMYKILQWSSNCRAGNRLRFNRSQSKWKISYYFLK